MSYLRQQRKEKKDLEYEDVDYRKKFTQQLVDGGDEIGYSVAQIANRQSVEGPTQRSLQHNTILLDSAYANANSNFTGGDVSWSITAANSNRSLSSIVGMTIADGWFPRITPASATQDVDPFFFREFYIQIVQLAATQGIKRFDGSSYHWSMNVDQLESQAVRVYPKQPSIIFQSPVNSLDEITIRISNAPLYRPLRIPPTRFRVAIYPGWAGLPAPVPTLATDLFIELLEGRFTDIAPVGVPITPGVAIHFASAINVNGSLLTLANNQPLTDPAGTFITEVFDPVVYGGRQFFRVSENYNAASFAPGATGFIIVGRNRFAFEIRFAELRENNTNFLSPNMTV
jgi:hypothetical protein